MTPKRSSDLTLQAEQCISGAQCNLLSEIIIMNSTTICVIRYADEGIIWIRNRI